MKVRAKKQLEDSWVYGEVIYKNGLAYISDIVVDDSTIQESTGYSFGNDREIHVGDLVKFGPNDPLIHAVRRDMTTKMYGPIKDVMPNTEVIIVGNIIDAQRLVNSWLDQFLYEL